MQILSATDIKCDKKTASNDLNVSEVLQLHIINNISVLFTNEDELEWGWNVVLWATIIRDIAFITKFASNKSTQNLYFKKLRSHKNGSK